MKTRNITQSLGKILLGGVLASASVSGCNSDLGSLTREDCVSLVDTDDIRSLNPQGWYEMMYLRLKYDGGKITNEALFTLYGYYHYETKDEPKNRYHLRVKNERDKYVFVERFDFPTGEKAEIDLRIPYIGDELLIEIYDPSCNRVLTIFTDF